MMIMIDDDDDYEDDHDDYDDNDNGRCDEQNLNLC